VLSPRVKLLLGPVATVVTLGGIALIDRVLGPVPNPGAIYFLAVVLATYISGFAPGLVSAAITFGFTFLHFSTSGDAQTIRAEDWTRLLILAATLPAIVTMVGLLKLQTDNALRKERQARSLVEGNNQELVALQAALDQVDYGVVLLDSELRAQFIDRRRQPPVCGAHVPRTQYTRLCHLQEGP
jgi:K+-sensing histidine kinase KdpD